MGLSIGLGKDSTSFERIDAEQTLWDLAGINSEVAESVLRLANFIKKLKPIPDCLEAPRALLVGGCVRDAFLGKQTRDVDIEVYGVEPKCLEDVLEKLFPERLKSTGKKFGILKILLGDNLEIDVSIPRTESKNGVGHNGFLVESNPALSPKEGARRRDFTMNTLAMDPLSGELFDDFGGLLDLQEHKLEVTDSVQFLDDPLRVYRGAQFTARFNLVPTERTLFLMKEMVSAGELEHLSAERITEEFKKGLLSPKPSVFLEVLDQVGVLERIFPELSALAGVPQDPRWHPEGDVWTHTRLVVDQAAKIINQKDSEFSEDEKLVIMLSALCHDLGKVTTTETQEDGSITARGHAQAGIKPTREFFAKFTFSNETIEAVCGCVAEHLAPPILYQELENGRLVEKSYQNAVRKVLRKIAPTSWKILLAVSEADIKGQGPVAAAEEFIEGIPFTNAALAIEKAAACKPLIQGRDLIELGLKPGPQFGELIGEVERLRDEGKISSKDEAIQYVIALLKL